MTRKAEVSTRVTELALRKVALNIASNKLGLDEAKTHALSHIKNLTQGAIDAKKQLKGMDWQEGLVLVAITGIALSVKAGLNQLEHLGYARLDLDKELKAGNATFLIPTNKEFRHLAQQQSGMDAYVELCEKHPDIYPYLSININDVKIGKGGKLISTLPFYKMSRDIPESLASDSRIDKMCQSISLFFKTQIDIFLKAIDHDFGNDSTFVDFFKSAWQGDNFLNNYRGPRLIIMSLGNLLWNLQHPIDLQTESELTLDEKIELCSRAYNFVNDLLNKEKKPNIDKLDPSGDLGNYIRQIETYIIGMKNAYEEEQNKSLTLNHVCTYAQRAARILNENIFFIVYRKKNQSATLASKIGYLNLLLDRDPYILSVLSEFSVSHPLMNTPPKTIIDLLLVYSQLNTEQKTKFETELIDTGKNIRKSFALTLREVNKFFIRPLYEAEKKELRQENSETRNRSWLIDNYSFSSSHHHLVNKLKEKAHRRAFFQFLPLVGLAINDYNISIDTTESRAASARSQLDDVFSFCTAREQVNKITKMASENFNLNKDAFVWDLSSHLSLEKIAEDTLNELCPKQYKIGRVTNLIRTIKKFISKFHSYLLKPEFKDFIIRCFDSINKEFDSLKELCFELQNEINSVTTEDRSLISQINNMDDDLSSEISSFMAEVKRNKRKLLSEEFEDNITNEILSNLDKISSKFSDVFGSRDDTLTTFINAEKVRGQSLGIVTASNTFSSQGSGHHFQVDSEVGSSGGSDLESDELEGSLLLDEEMEVVTPNLYYKQLAKLSSLMLECYKDMSYLSQQGVKGRKLLSLHEKMLARESNTTIDFKADACELAQIVCAYRPSLFFQAEYARTRSSDKFISAIINSINDEEFPLFDWVFDDTNFLEKMSGAQTKNLITEKLTAKKDESIWPLSTEQFHDSDPDLTLKDELTSYLRITGLNL